MPMNRDQHAATLSSYGRNGSVVDLSSTDATLGATVKGVVVTSIAGGANLVIRPKDGSSDITFTGVVVGFVPPYVPGIVRRTGTTCSLATIED